MMIQNVSLSVMFFVCFNRAFVPCFDSVTRRTCTLDPPSSFASCLALYTRSSTRTHICNPLDGRHPQDFVPELFRHPGGSGWDFQTASCAGLGLISEAGHKSDRMFFSKGTQSRAHTRQFAFPLSLPGSFLTAVPA